MAAFAPGTRVRVRNRNSPFYELEGTVREMTKTQRVYVLMSLFHLSPWLKLASAVRGRA